MQDLSGSLPGGVLAALVPTSQHGGNTSAENSAMTAPGIPSQGVAAADVHPAPAVDAITHGRTVLTSGDDAPGQVAPWTAADGSPWKSAADQEYLPRMQLARGSWNEV
jgi:hypothetical protein